MRKTVSIVLLLVFFFQSVGCLVIFKLQQLQVRQDVKHHFLSNLSNNELEVIKISKNRGDKTNLLNRFTNPDEFSYAGMMYDVIRKESHGDTMWYYCYPDKKETKVLAELDNFIRDQTTNNSQKKKQREDYQRILSSLFPAGYQEYSSIIRPFTHLNSCYLFHVKTWSSSPLTHPPQFS